MEDKIISRHKRIIVRFLKVFLSEKTRQYSAVHQRWSRDVMGRLLEFTRRGKMIRGSLIILAYQMFGKKINQEVIKTAGAIELFHSALLVHDDIMDNSALRRGKPAMHLQYQRLGEKEGFEKAGHFGMSSALCAGDVIFLITFELLSGLKIKEKQKEKIIRTFAQEMASVGLAQLSEMYLGYAARETSQREIAAIYQYKTARYTVSLPLMLGALLAGQPQSIVKLLMKLGEYIGVIFQIRDDYLGLFGRESGIGKSVGVDIRENKKTFYYHFLFKRASPAQKARLYKIFDRDKISQQQLRYVQKLIIELGVIEAVETRVSGYREQALKIIKQLKISQSYKKVLADLLGYMADREK
ncbi:MAG: polyprenyl synthetase family protein [Patescibacteria group bacterium]